MTQELLRCSKCHAKKNALEYYRKPNNTLYKHCIKCVEHRNNLLSLKPRVTPGVCFTCTDDFIEEITIKQDNKCYHCRELFNNKKMILTRLNTFLGCDNDNLILGCIDCTIKEGNNCLTMINDKCAFLL